MADLQVLDGGAGGRAARRTEQGSGAAVRHLRPVRPGERAGAVRPGVRVLQSRPAAPARPPVPSRLERPGPRLLVRPVPPVLPPHIVRRRQVALAVGVAVLTMLAVVLLGLLADVAAASRAGGDVLTERSLTAVVPASGQGVVPPPR